MSRRVNSLIPAALGAAIIMLFVASIGRPNVFTDTRDYMIHGARFYQALRRTFLNQRPPAPTTPEQERAWRKQQRQLHFDHSNMGARSPYYGIFLYTLAHRGTLWLLAAVQSFICAWMVYLLWRSMTSAAPGWTYYALMAALSMGTSLPWVASFAMPDVFAGVLIAAAALLAFYRSELARWEAIGVFALMTASLAFHGSHPPLALALIVVAVVLGRMLRAEPAVLKRSAGIMLAGIGLAMAAGWIYGEAVYWKTGDELRRPPFIAARVLADGPGRAYLRHACAKASPWVICRFKDLPLDDSDKILWSALPELGVFNRSDYDDRVEMEKQEFSFVLHTIAYDPLGQLGASLKNWGQQLVNFQVDDPLRPPRVFLIHKYWGHSNLVGLLRGVGCGESGLTCEPRVHITELELIDGPIVGLSLIALLIALFQPGALRAAWRNSFVWSEPTCRATAAALFGLSAIVINAAVCGMLAGVFARYQARVVWLAPAMSMLLVMALVPETVWRRVGIKAPAAWTGAGEAAWARTLPARAAGAALLTRLDPAFLRFFVVGAIGFVIDAAILHLLAGPGHVNPFAGQAIAFPIAVIATWLLNRIWTFRGAETSGKVRQAAVYFGVQCAGFAANYIVYSAALIAFPVLERWLILPLAMGAALGLCVTFLGAKHLAFRAKREGALASAPAVPETPAA